MNSLFLGALAGFIATVPMTAVMIALHRRLPKREQYPLPPREITVAIADKAGAGRHMTERQRTGATLAAHFGYGAATGALYAPLAQRFSLPPGAAAIGYGLAVWAASYLGLLPAIGILSPATEHPARRTGLMIAAHLIWGAALGLFVELTRRGAEGRE